MHYFNRSFCFIWVALFALLAGGCKQEPAKKQLSENFEDLTGKDLPTWKYIQTQEDKAHLNLFKQIYDSTKNYLHEPGSTARIPRSVHFIWLGPKPFPLKSIENVRTWMGKNPDWTFYFWTDRVRPLPVPGMTMRRVQDFSFLKLGDCFSKTENFGEKSDVLRYEILYQEGGVYVDHDVKCFKSFEPLNSSYDFYCGIDMPYTSNLPSCVFTTNNLIGIKPQHPIMLSCMNKLVEKWDEIEKNYPGEDRDSMVNRVHHRTFWLFGEAVKEMHNLTGNRDIVFPAYYFDAPNEELAIFARHQYAGVWHQSESVFELMVRKRLMTLTKKSNLTLLIIGVVSSLNLIGLGALFMYARRARPQS